MKLIVGLGNPGVLYRNTRHNVGILVAERLLRLKLPENVVVKKSDSSMNSSGSFVKSQFAKYRLQGTDLYITHDDLDIPLGSYKIQFGVGPKIHNGVNSVEKELGTKDFWRVRIGVDNRSLGEKVSGEKYVLEDFKENERKILDNVVSKVCKSLLAQLNQNH